MMPQKNITISYLDMLGSSFFSHWDISSGGIVSPNHVVVSPTMYVVWMASPVWFHYGWHLCGDLSSSNSFHGLNFLGKQLYIAREDNLCPVAIW